MDAGIHHEKGLVNTIGELKPRLGANYPSMSSKTWVVNVCHMVASLAFTIWNVLGEISVPCHPQPCLIRLFPLNVSLPRAPQNGNRVARDC